MTRRSVQALVAAAAVLLGISLSGCTATPGSQQLPPAPPAMAFGHVHGLGVDPASGVVYAATHDGVFELPPLDSAPVEATDLAGPIADRMQDTMGFTMVGSDMFGSGHPDPASALPPSLGFITSTDQALTWQNVSLEGETDFHDVDVVANGANTVVYGYDSRGIIKISQDRGTTWTDGASIELRDLTADPASPGTVYATTAEGLAISTDSGATFAPVADAPSLYLVQTMGDAPGGLIGIAVDGAVWVKAATGEWQSAGSVTGQVQAMFYSTTPTAAILVATERAIVVSYDLGATWNDLVSW